MFFHKFIDMPSSFMKTITNRYISDMQKALKDSYFCKTQKYFLDSKMMSCKEHIEI